MLRVALIGSAFDVKGRKTYAPDVSKWLPEWLPGKPKNNQSNLLTIRFQ